MSVPTLAPSVPGSTASPPRLRVVAPEFRVADSPAAAVLRAAVQHGPIARDTAARVTGASIATVNRHVAALLAAGLLRERADLAESGAIGRPRVPFDVNHEAYLTIGIHIGAVVTSIVASDLRGRILGGAEIPTPVGRAHTAVAGIAHSAGKFAARWNRRQPLWVGVALGGRVDAGTGVVDHERLGWRTVPVGPLVGDILGLPVSVSTHVEAMAAAELLLAPRAPHDTRAAGTTLYFYARETAGAAIALANRVHTPSNGPGSIAHLPTTADVVCECGQRGCLEAAVSDRAVLTRAVERGLLPTGNGAPAIGTLYRAARGGSPGAHELLVERARVLGRAVATLRDIFNPDRVILGGQAFTEYPAAVPHVAEAFTQTSTLARKDFGAEPAERPDWRGAEPAERPDWRGAEPAERPDWPRITGFGDRVQQFAAAVTSLSALYADPIPAMRRATGSRTKA